MRHMPVRILQIKTVKAGSSRSSARKERGEIRQQKEDFKGQVAVAIKERPGGKKKASEFGRSENTSRAENRGGGLDRNAR